MEFPPEDDLDARVNLSGLLPLSVADVSSFLLPSNPYKLLSDAILKLFRAIQKASWVFMVLSIEELAEMAHGPASTSRPFLWVVRPDCSVVLSEGYLDSVAWRGMVVPWSLQDLVLAHPSTACFLTHDGWYSTLAT
ncbi:putative UDP-glucose glucosyltransferase [Aegilops tauschii subsp. strangulata]|uniref:putative UDP-glucose glucosyltransferase n=1 Tax=Aegilops tauschii subsp. strangulata TaxID=200361 RepID=UPI003CC8A77C